MSAALARKVEAWAQRELGAQQTLLALLGRQERALQGRDADELDAASRALGEAAGAERGRAAERDALVAALARTFGVAPSTVSLRSAAERLGPEGERLERLRVELRAAAEEVAHRGRRVAWLARQQGQIAGELLGAVLGPGDGRNWRDGGTLVDAEG